MRFLFIKDIEETEYTQARSLPYLPQFQAWTFDIIQVFRSNSLIVNIQYSPFFGLLHSAFVLLGQLKISNGVRLDSHGDWTARSTSHQLLERFT